MKTKEELNALKEEVETLKKKLAEPSEEELAQVTGGVGSNHDIPDEGKWYSKRGCRSIPKGGYPTCMVFRCIHVASRDEASFEQYEQAVKPEGIVLTYIQSIQGCPADFDKILDPNIWPVW